MYNLPLRHSVYSTHTHTHFLPILTFLYRHALLIHVCYFSKRMLSLYVVHTLFTVQHTQLSLGTLVVQRLHVHALHHMTPFILTPTHTHSHPLTFTHFLPILLIHVCYLKLQSECDFSACTTSSHRNISQLSLGTLIDQRLRKAWRSSSLTLFA
jgi:hypothetical protein